MSSFAFKRSFFKLTCCPSEASRCAFRQVRCGLHIFQEHFLFSLPRSVAVLRLNTSSVQSFSIAKKNSNTQVNHNVLTLLQTQHITTSAVHSGKQTAPLDSSKTGRNSSSIVTTTAYKVREAQSESHRAEDKGPLRQRFIYVQTSRELWEDVPGGILLDVAYLDSAPDGKISRGVPLVVSLHNTPGSFHDMQPILEAFVKAGCRVLAPAFPGLGLTEGVTKGFNDIFTHTTTEKADFVKDFLMALGIDKVDLLISHGSGSYPAMRLTSGQDTSHIFKSAAFLAPWPHRHFRGTSQKNLVPLLHDMWERPFYRPFARALSKFIPNSKNTTALERITTVYTLHNVDFSEIGGFSVALDTKKFPRVMLFAEDDDFVEAELSYELADMMGINSNNIHRFSDHLQKGQMETFPSCLVFEKGGQKFPQTHAGIVTAVLFNLLKSVRPGFSC